MFYWKQYSELNEMRMVNTQSSFQYAFKYCDIAAQPTFRMKKFCGCKYLPLCPNLGCQYIHTIFSYQNICARIAHCASCCDDRPAIVPVVNARIAAFSKHWLDGKARPRFQMKSWSFEMEHMRQHMNLRTNTMSGKLANNTIIVRWCNIVDAVTLMNERGTPYC